MHTHRAHNPAIALVVNGDDFGYSDAINAAIIHCHREGVLTSTTVLVNRPATGAALALAGDNPALGVGLHLNLTAGVPVLSPDEVPSLVDARGRFRYVDEQLWRLAAGRLKLAEIAREFRAQFAILAAHGIRPTHIDGHLHAHACPGILPLVIRLMAEWGVRAMRSPHLGAWLPPRFRPPDAHRRGPRGGLLTRAGIVIADQLLDAARFLATPDPVDALVTAVRAIGSGTVEIMAHPAWNRDAARGAAQIALLTAPRLRDALDAAGIRRVAYGDLATRARHEGAA